MSAVEICGGELYTCNMYEVELDTTCYIVLWFPSFSL